MTSLGDTWMTDDLWKKGATLIVMAPIRPICSGVAFVDSANTCQASVSHPSELQLHPSRSLVLLRLQS